VTHIGVSGSLRSTLGASVVNELRVGGSGAPVEFFKRCGSGNFASSTFVNPLASFNPNPFSWANSLDSTLTLRNNGLAAGLPANFLMANPNKLGGAQVTGNGGYTNFHSAQFELRRRMANGLQFNSSYVFGRARTSQFFSFRVPRIEALDGGSRSCWTNRIDSPVVTLLDWTTAVKTGRTTFRSRGRRRGPAMRWQSSRRWRRAERRGWPGTSGRRRPPA
jgi:hypothetical protein